MTLTITKHPTLSDIDPRMPGWVDMFRARDRLRALLALLGADVDALGWGLAADAATDRAKTLTNTQRHLRRHSRVSLAAAKAARDLYAATDEALSKAEVESRDLAADLTAANAKIAELEKMLGNVTNELQAAHYKLSIARVPHENPWCTSVPDRVGRLVADRDQERARAVASESRARTLEGERDQALADNARMVRGWNDAEALAAKAEAERDAAVRGREEAERLVTAIGTALHGDGAIYIREQLPAKVNRLRVEEQAHRDKLAAAAVQLCEASADRAYWTACNERQALVIRATREALGADEVDGIPRAIERLKSRNKTLSSDNKVCRRDVERLESQLAASEQARTEQARELERCRPVVEAACRYSDCVTSGTHDEAERCGRRDALVAAVSAIRAQGAGVAGTEETP